jgi:hypothetical protein
LVKLPVVALADRDLALGEELERYLVEMYDQLDEVIE